MSRFYGAFCNNSGRLSTAMAPEEEGRRKRSMINLLSSEEHAHNGLASARQDGRVPRPLAPGLRGLCASEEPRLRSFRINELRGCPQWHQFEYSAYFRCPNVSSFSPHRRLAKGSSTFGPGRPGAELLRNRAQRTRYGLCASEDLPTKSSKPSPGAAAQASPGLTSFRAGKWA